MSEISTVLNNNISYNLYEYCKYDSLEYSYRGMVDSDVVENILSLAEANLSNAKEQTLIRKKVYFVMVECLQNITRHQEINTDPNFDQNAIFILRRKKTSYSITSANLIKDTEVEKLRTKIDNINAMTSDELKDYARKVLSNGTFSSKGGAGLGLIEMARKAGTKFQYIFVPTKYEMSMFYMTIEIPVNKDEIPIPDTKAIDNVRKYHRLLQDANIALNYSGMLSQGNLKTLMNILGKQINTSKALKLKVNNIMIEMLQNIICHADRREHESENSCYGMFVVSQDKKHLKISTANFIKNSKIPQVQNLLEKINKSDKAQRSEMGRNPNTPGQGFITIINKSRHPYTYNFNKIDNTFSLYSIDAFLEKEYEGNITM